MSENVRRREIEIVLGVQVAETEVGTGAAEAPAVVAVRRGHDRVANRTVPGIF